MKKIIFPVYLICVLSLLSGCSHYYYAPNAANIPLFKEKNTFKGKVGFSSDYYRGADIQMAYSASKNIGIMVNSFLVGKTEQVQDNINTSATRGIVEVGLSSRFSALNLKVKKSNLAFETNHEEKQNLDSIILHPSSILWEPSLIVGAGWQDFKFYFQITLSNNLNNPYLTMDFGNISVGIKFTIKNNQTRDKKNSN